MAAVSKFVIEVTYPGATRRLDAEFPTHARAFAFLGLVKGMVRGGPRSEYRIVEIPDEPAPRQWGPQ